MMSLRSCFVFSWCLLASVTLHAEVGLAGTAITDPLASDGGPLPAERLVLLVVDRSGDGFAAATEGALTQGDVLSEFISHPDDVVVASLSSSIVFGRSAIPGNVTVSLTDGVDAGDPFAVIFFDQLAEGSLTIDVATSYAVATDPTWVLPADGQFLQYLASGGDESVAQLSGLKTDLAVSGTSVSEIGYLDWAQSFFGDAMLPLAQPEGDPDGDGFANLFEYAFGMDPAVPNEEGEASIRFAVNEQGETLSVAYTRPVEPREVEIGIEVSTDLLTWDRDPSELQEEWHEVSEGVERRRLTMVLGESGYRFARFVVVEPSSSDWVD